MSNAELMEWLEKSCFKLKFLAFLWSRAEVCKLWSVELGGFQTELESFAKTSVSSFMCH